MKGPHQCDNCRKTWWLRDLDGIEDFFQRVEAGSVVPSGQCPGCRALCYPRVSDKNIKVTIPEAKSLLELLQGVDREGGIQAGCRRQINHYDAIAYRLRDLLRQEA